MYNKKALKVDLGKFVKPNPYKQDIITDPAGQWKYPGVPTRIPSGQITMQGVPYPVMAYPNMGQPVMMQPGQEYNFPGADYVDEYPQMKKGGYMPSLPNKKTSKAYSRSLTATNKLFAQSPLTKKSKSRKNKIFDPSSTYYQDGGAFEDDIDKRRQLLRDWTYGADIGMLQEQDGGPYFEGYNEDSPWLGENYKDIGVSVGAGRFNVSAGNYFPKSVFEPASNFNPYVNLGVDLNKNRNLSFEYTPGYAGVTFTKSFQDGGTPHNYNPFVSNEPEASEQPQQFTPIRTENDPEDYDQFLNYSETAPENRRPDANYIYGDSNNYDHYGMWDALGKPKDFNQALEMNPDWVPDEYDGYYHGFSVNPNTGVFLKAGKPGLKPGDTTWMEVAGHYLSPRADVDTPVFDPELNRFKYVPNEEYIEAELTPEEIEEYRKGGYVVEDISVPTLTKAEYGMPMGTGMSQNYMGRTKTLYQTGGRTLPKPRSKNYDPLYTITPQVTESTAVRNLPKQDKKVVEKAMAKKTTERKAVAQKIQANPLLTQAQKNEILLDPRKLDENVNLAYEKGADNVKQVEPQSTASRAWEYITNPMTALEYEISGGGAENMPHNINEMRMAGIDPGVVAGRNIVGNTLDNLNPLDDIKSVYEGARDIVKGNNSGYTTAGLGLLGFIPGGDYFKGLGKISKAAETVKDVSKIDDEMLNAYNLAVNLKNKGKISSIPDSPYDFDKWLQTQYNKRPIYRVVDVNPEVMSNPNIRAAIKKQGLDPDNQHHVAEYMGTTVAPADVVNRGRRSGGHEELIQGSNKDIMYYAEDPEWLGSRYGGRNPYYVKAYADELPEGLQNQVLGLRSESRVRKNYNRNYPQFDINKVPSGVLFEDKYLRVGPNVITPILGDKGAKVRKSVSVLSGADFDKLTNKRFALGGAASPTDLNPATMKKYKEALKTQENSVKAGYNKAQDKWYPHKSPEGGNKTIGYGHKLTDAENNKFIKGISSGEVDQMLQSDILKHQAIAENIIDNKYGKGAFDRLPQASQMLFVDYAYNGVLGKFPTFTDAVVKKNKDLMLKEYERGSKAGKLVNRNNWTRSVIEDNYQEGGYIELELTPEEIQDYIAQGYTIDELD